MDDKKKDKWNVRNIISFFIFIICGVVFVFTYINHYNANEKLKCVLNKHELVIDTFRYSLNSEGKMDSLIQKDIEHALEITRSEIQSCSNWFFDNNTITFLVSFALILLVTLILDFQNKLRNESKEMTDKINSITTYKIKKITTLNNSQQLKIKEINKNYSEKFDNKTAEYNQEIQKFQNKIEEFETIIEKLKKSNEANAIIVSNDIKSADISIQFKSLFLESLFFSLSLKTENYKLNSKFAILAYNMDKRKDSINNFLSQYRDFKIKTDTKNDVIETLTNTIRNIEIEKIKKEPANTKKTRPYELLVVELEELLNKVKKLEMNENLQS